MRQTPNKDSITLRNAIIGGAGLGLPPNLEIPEGMGAVLLYVPMEQVTNKTIQEIQNDIGLPWHMYGAEPVWFDDLAKNKKG